MSTRQRIKPGDGDERHGTSNGYGNLECRCDACRSAWADEYRAARARREERLPSSTAEHGRYTTYLNHRCRCQPCRAAHASWRRGQRVRSAVAS